MKDSILTLQNDLPSYVKAYLSRIGVKIIATPSLSFLIHLQRQHFLTFGLDSLDVFYQRPYMLNERQIIEERILRENRGGICVSLNGAFCHLLKNLGFDADLVSVFSHGYNERRNQYTKESHAAIIVNLNNNLYLVDVGFGDMFRSPLQLNNENSEAIGYKVVLNNSSQRYELHKLCENTWYLQYDFSLIKQTLTSLINNLNYIYSSAHIFTQALVFNKPTLKGSKTLFKNQYTEVTVTDGISTSVTMIIDNFFKLQDILRTKFDVRGIPTFNPYEMLQLGDPSIGCKPRQGNKSYCFPMKGQGCIGVIELISKSKFIDEDLARSVLVESFIGEYEQYLAPSEISDGLTSWRGDNNSVQKYYEDYFETELEDFSRGEVHYWVQATTDGKVVGWATFQREKSDQNAVYMNLLVVHPDYQNRGIGRQLVNALINLNVIPDLNAIHLLLRKKNKGGRVFYLKLGFTPDPKYQRDDNFVNLDLLEGFTWKKPSLQNKEAACLGDFSFRETRKLTLFKSTESKVAEQNNQHNTYCGFKPGFLLGV